MADDTGAATTNAALEWTGDGLDFRARNPKGAEIRLASGTAEPAFSPMDAMLSAVAACMAVDVVDILTKMRKPPRAYAIEAAGWRAEKPPRKFLRIQLTHRLRGPGLDEPSVRRAVALSQATYCSAMSSLDPAIEVENVVVVEG